MLLLIAIKGEGYGIFHLNEAGLKKLEFQLVFFLSSPHALFVWVHFLLISVNDFVRGRLARTLTHRASKLKKLLAQQEN